MKLSFYMKDFKEICKEIVKKIQPKICDLSILTSHILYLENMKYKQDLC